MGEIMFFRMTSFSETISRRENYYNEYQHVAFQGYIKNSLTSNLYRPKHLKYTNNRIVVGFASDEISSQSSDEDEFAENFSWEQTLYHRTDKHQIDADPNSIAMKIVSSLEENHSFVLKRRLLIMAFIFRMFFVGVQYSVILPTCMLYMKRFDVGETFTGTVIAAYPFASMISAFVVGFAYNKTRRVKEIMLVMNTFQIVGNIVYALPYSPWLPLAGRFICGLGDSFIGATIGEICEVYPKTHRTGIISLIEFGRIFGFILGPLLHMVIQRKRYQLGGIEFDSTTFPGLAMTCFWIIMQLVTLFWVSNLSKSIRDNPDLMNERDKEFSFTDKATDEEKKLLSKDTKNGMASQQQHAKSEEEKSTYLNNNNKERRSQPNMFEEISRLCTANVIVIFYLDTILWLAQSVFEFLLPLIAEFEYGWSPFQTGLVYMAGGVELIMVFGYLYYISKRNNFRDTYLILWSLVMTLLALMLLIFERLMPSKGQKIGMFVTICGLMFIAVPLNLTGVKSLLSKITRPEFQGITQGLYGSVCSFSLIIGPMLGSLIYKHRAEYGGVTAMLTITCILALCVCMERLHDREDQITIETENQEFLKDLATFRS